MQPRQISVRMTVEQGRKLSSILQAMIKADDAMSVEEARKGVVSKALRYAKHSEECTRILEAVESAIAHRPLPLYMYDEIEVVE